MNVVIIGAGGQGEVVLDILQESGRHQVMGFIDTSPLKQRQGSVQGIPILGGMKVLRDAHEHGFQGAIVAIGDAQHRSQMASDCEHANIKLINAIHSSAVVSHRATLGSNITICANAVVAAGALVDNDCIINTAATIDHGCNIYNGCFIAPGAHLAGEVTLCAFSFIGTGANIIPRLSIGFRSIVGAGSVVLKPVPQMTVVAGVPAKVIECFQDGYKGGFLGNGIWKHEWREPKTRKCSVFPGLG